MLPKYQYGTDMKFVSEKIIDSFIDQLDTQLHLLHHKKVNFFRVYSLSLLEKIQIFKNSK